MTTHTVSKPRFLKWMKGRGATISQNGGMFSPGFTRYSVRVVGEFMVGSIKVAFETFVPQSKAREFIAEAEHLTSPNTLEKKL